MGGKYGLCIRLNRDKAKGESVLGKPNGKWWQFCYELFRKPKTQNHENKDVRYVYGDDGEVIGDRIGKGQILTGKLYGKEVIWGGTEEELRADRRRSKKAKEPLAKEDEQIAHRLCDLLSERTKYYDPYRGKIKVFHGIEFAPSALEEIREIGESLYAKGGMEKTLMVAYRVREFGGSVRLLEACWEYIGDWRY